MIAEIYPHIALTPYVTKYSFIDLSNYYNSERCIPDGSIKLFVYENENCIDYQCINSQKKYTWKDGVGGHPLSADYEMKVSKPVKLIICHFRPSGFYRLFGIPVHLLNDDVIPVEEIFGRKFKEMKNSLIESETVVEKKSILDNCFLDFISTLKINSLKGIDKIEQYILNRGGNIKIEDTLHNTSLSLRSIERHFLNFVGMPPKYFCRVIRFNKTLLLLKKHRNIDWKEIMFQNGYYDQSHYISEFRYFTGFSPNKFKQNESINALYVGKFLEEHLK